MSTWLLSSALSPPSPSSCRDRDAKLELFIRAAAEPMFGMQIPLYAEVQEPNCAEENLMS